MTSRPDIEALALALLLVLTACPKRPPEPVPRPAPTPSPLRETEPVGVFHELRRGETLYGLARRYRIDVDELIEVNGISDVRDLRVGRLIFIPDVDPMAPVPPPIAADAASPPPLPAPPPPTARGARLIWPVDAGVLYSGFGIRQGVRHDGIDLGAPEGTPVRAAAAGEVIYVGADKAFGNLVIVRHADRLVTVYAHNQQVLVAIGQP
ncbi:MAG: LysM peptidoglycan-binding domain-containing M23 family metallopeptidase, partial [Deltaproteobacteria bacterium]|nr:LysM peptidoglycan-binding domain-containing M23 family metallopeptidase [Deltaproteobacteria bacterium]